MTNSFFGKIIIYSFSGFIIGILILIAALKTETIPILGAFFDFIHKPASWLAYFWSDILKLPPQSELAFAVVPMVAAVLQWTFLGFLFGLWKK